MGMHSFVLISVIRGGSFEFQWSSESQNKSQKNNDCNHFEIGEILLINLGRKTNHMAIHITSECINCGACEPECPNNAIYEGGAEWAMSDGTTLKGTVTLLDGTTVEAEQRFPPISDDLYYIVPNKCTECEGFHEEPQCAAVCPVDCCVPDPEHVETKEQLLQKKEKLHL
jgi:ferredoxin